MQMSIMAKLVLWITFVSWGQFVYAHVEYGSMINRVLISFTYRAFAENDNKIIGIKRLLCCVSSLRGSVDV